MKKKSLEPVVAFAVGKSAFPRIPVMDVTRGIAILLIFFFNIPNMGNSNYEHFGAIKLLGWTRSDQVCWWFLNVFLAGTQRGLLQILFGAGALILLRDTLEPHGQLAAADTYFRRNILLIAFGLFDIFGLLWFGDILFAYGFAAIFLFPLRKVPAGMLLALALLFPSYMVVQGSIQFHQTADRYRTAVLAQGKQSSHQPLTPSENEALTAVERSAGSVAPALLQEERKARFGPPREYVHWFHNVWFRYLWHGGGLQQEILESFFTMLFGMALYKWGVVQGKRSARYYLWLCLIAYSFGLIERVSSTWQTAQFSNLPNVGAFGSEPARLLVTVGHLALINLLIQTGARHGLRLLFEAPGRMAFSLYLTQNLIGDWILFPGFGLGLWGRYGWLGLTSLAAVMALLQAILANVWLKYFAVGPLEWLWRSLIHLHAQPWRRSIYRAEGST